MGPLVVVMLDPQPYPLACRLKAVELGSHQELFPDRLPESLDLAQRHGMMGPAFDVMNPVLAQLRLEARRPPPTGVLAALIGEHFLGHAVLSHRPAVHLQHVLRRLAAKHLQPHHIARVIIQKGDEVGVLASQAEGEDIGLPHLVGGGALEEARLRGMTRRLGARLLEQLLLVQGAANRLPAHRQEPQASQELADFLDAEVGMAPLELDDLRLHRRRHFRSRTARTSWLRLQARFTLGAVQPHPLGQGASPHLHFVGHPLQGEAFLHT